MIFSKICFQTHCICFLKDSLGDLWWRQFHFAVLQRLKIWYKCSLCHISKKDGKPQGAALDQTAVCCIIVASCPVLNFKLTHFLMNSFLTLITIFSFCRWLWSNLQHNETQSEWLIFYNDIYCRLFNIHKVLWMHLKMHTNILQMLCTCNIYLNTFLILLKS